MSELEEIDKKIAKTRKKLAALKKRRESVVEKDEPFRRYEAECLEITQRMDAWTKDMAPPQQRDFPLSILFLGACSGEWAARTRYRGSLPGFGGFMVMAGGEHILVDPGRSSFIQLLYQGIHPKHLNAVVVTHSHWDCIRDLNLILMAACPVIKENLRHLDDNLRLYADRSVLHGIEMDVEAAVQGSKDYGYPEEAIADFKTALAQFPHSVPGVLTAYDLFLRLRGRFEQIEVNRKYRIGPNVDLYTRPSFHTIAHVIDRIPALDFVTHQNGEPIARCVYLSDTEYRRELAEIYSQDIHKLGPVDVLICNVKTLNVFEKPEGQEYAGFTRKHLGWKGLLQLTEDLHDKQVLVPRSIVVLRAWGIETVTQLDDQDGALIASPEKLHTYEEKYKQISQQHAVIPDITWVDVEARHKPVSVKHIRPPFQRKGEYRSFGGNFYCSQAMAAVVRSAKAVTDNRLVTVLITGESGSGKDELAKAIHQEAASSRKRSGQLVVQSAASLEPTLAESTLFGSEIGAFTDAKKKDGWLTQAKDGTLVIQEVARMPDVVQGKFLTCLEERKYQPLGGDEIRDLTAQVIFTTDADLRDKVGKGEFSEQLRQRIKRYIEIPPLRERPEDIPCIIEGLRRRGTGNFKNMPALNSESIEILQEYRWPGNVRQLERVLDLVIESGDFSPANVREIVKNDHDWCAPPGSRPSGPNKSGNDLDDDLRRILSVFNNGEALKKKDIAKKLGENNNSTLMNRINVLIVQEYLRPIGRGRKRTYVLKRKPDA